MSSLGIKKVAFQYLSVRDKIIVRGLFSLITCGKPARFSAPDLAEWYIFDDGRFDLNSIARLGCVLSHLEEISSEYQIPPTKVELVEDIVSFTNSHGVVLPKDIEFSEGGNAWQETLNANNAPNSVKMASLVPENWTPEIGD
jgi:hypothetical protein